MCVCVYVCCRKIGFRFPTEPYGFLIISKAEALYCDHILFFCVIKLETDYGNQNCKNGIPKVKALNPVPRYTLYREILFILATGITV